MNKLTKQIKDVISLALDENTSVNLIEKNAKNTGKDLENLSAEDLPEFISSLESSVKTKIEDKKTLKKVIRSLESIKVKSILSTFGF